MIHRAARDFLLAVIIALLLVLPLRAEPSTQPSGNGKSNGQRKPDREQNLARAPEEKRRQGRVVYLPPAANPRQFAEDFDRSVQWEQKNNRGDGPKIDYGYS